MCGGGVPAPKVGQRNAHGPPKVTSKSNIQLVSKEDDTEVLNSPSHHIKGMPGHPFVFTHFVGAVYGPLGCGPTGDKNFSYSRCSQFCERNRQHMMGTVWEQQKNNSCSGGRARASESDRAAVCMCVHVRARVCAEHTRPYTGYVRSWGRLHLS